MKISPIKHNKFINFRSKVTSVYHGKISDELAQKIDDFEETHKDARELGSGLFARAYILNGTNCVIKESLPSEFAKKQNKDFFPEAQALEMLPPSVKNTQKLIALVQTEKDNYYLLSTFVEGTPASYPEHPWDKSSFDGLFETLLSLDKAGIYHNDINQANCLIDKNYRASTIDYQFADTFRVDDRDNDKKFKTKSDMMPSNAQMFEMASLPWYIRTMSKTAPKEEVRNLFKTYLEAKSRYAKQRALYLQQKVYYRDMARYELLQAKFFENPTDEIIDLQAKKLQLLYSFRKTFSVTDQNNNHNKNIGSAIQSYIYTLAAAKDMENYANYLARETSEPNLKTFYKYEADYARFWFNEMEDELGLKHDSGVLSWLERNAELKLKHHIRIVEDYDYYWGSTYYKEDLGISEKEDLSKNFEAAEHILPANIDDIAGMIIEENAEEGTRLFDTLKENEIRRLGDTLEKQITQSNSVRPNTINKDVIDYIVQKEKYVSSSKAVIEHIKKNGFNALIASAILAQYQKNIAKNTFNNLLNKVDLGENFVFKQRELLNADLNLDILKKSAKMLVEYIAKSTGEEALESKRFLRFL